MTLQRDVSLGTAAASCDVGEPGSRVVPNVKSFPGLSPRARLDLFVAVVAIHAAELAHEGGPVPHQCQMVFSFCLMGWQLP